MKYLIILFIFFILIISAVSYYIISNQKCECSELDYKTKIILNVVNGMDRLNKLSKASTGIDFMNASLE